MNTSLAVSLNVEGKGSCTENEIQIKQCLCILQKAGSRILQMEEDSHALFRRTRSG